MKKELSVIKKEIKSKQLGFVKKLKKACAELDEAGACELVLGILRSGLDEILVRYVAEHRQQVIAAFENWWAKYLTILHDLKMSRNQAASNLDGFIKGLGYA
jgi:type I restriction enzyme M protein